MKTKFFIASVMLVLLTVLAVVVLNKNDTAGTEDKTVNRLMPLPTSEQTTPKAKEQTTSTKTLPAKLPACNSDKNFRIELEKLLANSDYDTFSALLGEWANKDPDAAKRWVGGSNLPDEKKKDLLKIIDENQK